MRVLDEICDVLEGELKEIVRNGDMSPSVLDNTYKAVDIIKDIKTIDAMDNSVYDGRYSYGWDDDYSMARNRERHIPMRDRGYSREDSKEHLMAKMEEMKRQIESMNH